MGYGDWVGTWEGYTGCTTQPPSAARGTQTRTAERAPEAQRAGVGGTGLGGRVSLYHPPGPVGLSQPSLYRNPLRTPLLANKGEI